MSHLLRQVDTWEENALTFVILMEIIDNNILAN